jgi:Cu-Zn family superoxide dismutase
MRRVRWIVLSFSLIAVLAFAVDAFNNRRSMRVSLINPDGRETGVVTLRPLRNHVTLVTGQVWGLKPGHHGFHVHETGRCEVTDEGAFITARGHFDIQTGRNHGDHAGDMPSLLADAEGSAYISFRTASFGIDDLFDDDGSALIVHAGADNFANIPERYGGADETTLANGDAGSRVACGVVERG